MPHKAPFVTAAAWWFVHLLTGVGACTALIMVYLDPRPLGSVVFILLGSTTLVSWFIAFFKRRAARCPLCKGTPMVCSGARAHQRARRLGPINEGVFAMLNLLTVQSFRCMDCGTDYDLMKPSSRHSYKSEYKD